MPYFNTVISPANEVLDDALAPYVAIKFPNRAISDLVLDVTVEEVHNDRLEVTQHPIATGAVVTDHSFALPATLTIRGGSSDSTAGYVGYAQQIYDYFLALQASRMPFQVSTGRRFYDNMLIRDLQVTTDATYENAVMCTINLQQVTFTDVGMSSGGPQGDQAYPASTGTTVDAGMVQLQPVTTPQPFLSGAGVGGLPVPNPSAGGIGSA